MKKIQTSVPGESSNWRKKKKGYESGVELNLYAPKDANAEAMEEMITDFPMKEVEEWIKKYNYQSLIVIDPT